MLSKPWSDGSSDGRVPRLWAAVLLDGLRAAARIVCGSEATREALLAQGLCRRRASRWCRIAARTRCCQPGARSGGRCGSAERRLGGGGTMDLLHGRQHDSAQADRCPARGVRRIRRRRPEARLLRVGGPMTPEQHRRRAAWAWRMPSCNCRSWIGACWRRCTGARHSCCSRPSGRASACRWPKRWRAARPSSSSDVPALREAGGIAATYCRVGDLDAWAAAAAILLEERAEMGLAWAARRLEALAHGQRFSLDAHVRGVLAVYRDVVPEASRTARAGGGPG